MLHYLLQHPGVKQVTCLVRRKGVESRARRLQKAMERYDICPADFELLQKISVPEGDIRNEYLALGETIFFDLAQRKNIIFYVAAKVNFAETYQQHYHDNILGTKHVLRLATISSTCPALTSGVPRGYSSAHSKSSRTNHYSHRSRPYDMISDTGRVSRRPKSWYGECKNGGFLWRHSQTGAWNPADFIGRWLVGCIQMGVFPRIKAMRFEYSTMDFVCQAVLHIASKQESFGRAYDLVASNQSQ
ncbi:male sterility protein-domain-containing protein [Aspergillus karnatakaensis]|uniref:male sterility protein-domain-containing protein n=1 Tax=Aspergillus karnatakaensis TaxID=1810916 RepID=UPI003CCCDDBC